MLKDQPCPKDHAKVLDYGTVEQRCNFDLSKICGDITNPSTDYYDVDLDAPVCQPLDFSGKHLSFTVGELSSTVDVGTGYAHVAHLRIGTEHLAFSFTVAAATNICEATRIFYGYKDSTGAHAYVELSFGSSSHHGGAYMCSLDMNEKLTRRQLNDASNIWLATNAPKDTIVHVYRTNEDESVVPLNQMLYYKFALDPFTADSITDEDDGITFTLKVQALTYDDQPATSDDCKQSAQDLLPQLKFNEACSILLHAHTTDGDIETLSYKMTKAQYNDCNTIETSEGTVVYSGSFELPMKGTGDEEGCYYFQNHDIKHPYRITMTTIVQDTTSATAKTEIVTDIDDVDLVECPTTGVDDIIPQAKLNFTVTVRYSGQYKSDTVESSTLESGGGIILVDKDCTTVPQVCVYVIESKDCAHIYEIVDGPQEGYCVFDASKFKVWKGATFTVEEDDVEITHDLELKTNINLMQFHSAECIIDDDPAIVDVTDRYDVVVEVRNQDSDSYNGALAWHEPLVARLTVTDTHHDFDDREVQFTSITATIKDDNGAAIASQLISRSEKLALLHIHTTPYYKDAHFCRFYETDGKTCGAFYNEYSSPPRWNTIMDENPPPYTCDDGVINDPRSDYVTINLDAWLKPPESTLIIKLEFEAIGVIQECDARRRRRRRGSTTEPAKYVHLKRTVFVSTASDVHVDPATGIEVLIEDAAVGAHNDGECLSCMIAGPAVGFFIVLVVGAGVSVHILRQSRWRKFDNIQ